MPTIHTPSTVNAVTPAVISAFQTIRDAAIASLGHTPKTLLIGFTCQFWRDTGEQPRAENWNVAHFGESTASSPSGLLTFSDGACPAVAIEIMTARVHGPTPADLDQDLHTEARAYPATPNPHDA